MISWPRDGITNREFAQNNAEFRAACAAAKLEPSARQAAKFRAKRGTAWRLYLDNHRNGAGTHLDIKTRNP